MTTADLRPLGAHLQSDAVLLRAECLGRCVPGKILVAGVTFDVRGGETLALVGPSGSGKTSLLRLLNRLDEPTSGTVFLNGADYRQLVPRDLRRRVGMVTQRAYLFPGTVAGNLRFGPGQRGEELPDDQVDELLSGVGLVGYAARNVATLSVEKHSESRLHAYWLTRPRYCCSDCPKRS